MLGRLWCFVRGYHESYYEVNGYQPPNVNGNVSPCRFCGRRPKIGNVPDSYTLLIWESPKEFNDYYHPV